MVLTLGDDNHANVFGFSNDLQNQIFAQEAAPRVMFRTAEKDLRDLIATCKIDDRVRGVVAFQSPCLDVKISSEVEVFFDCFRASRGVTLARARYGNCETIGAQIVGPSSAPADQHGGGGVGSKIDQNPIAHLLL